jgi:hypothetical protein
MNVIHSVSWQGLAKLISPIAKSINTFIIVLERLL